MKKVLKFLGFGFIIVIALLVFLAIVRQQTYPSQIRSSMPNETLSRYYEENGKAPAAFTHEPIDSFDYTGTVQAKHLLCIPEAEQVQISVRYGIVALESIAKEYDLASVPDLDGGKIKFRLRAFELIEGAFTNDDKNVDEDEIISFAQFDVSYVRDLEMQRHMYHRLAFDGVDFEKYNCFYLDMYYENEDEAYTSIIIYHEDAAKHGKTVVLKEKDCKNS